MVHECSLQKIYIFWIVKFVVTKPATPANLAVSGEVGQTSLSLMFDAVSGAVSYQVEGNSHTYL